MGEVALIKASRISINHSYERFVQWKQSGHYNSINSGHDLGRDIRYSFFEEEMFKVYLKRSGKLTGEIKTVTQVELCRKRRNSFSI